MSDFKKQTHFTRQVLDKIVDLSVNKPVKRVTAEQRRIGILLSSVTRNRLLAKNKIYKKGLRKHQDYIRNWLWLKARLRPEVVNTLLLRQDKMR